MSASKQILLVLLSGLTLVSVGCSSGDMGTVTGTVKADGKPLPDALLEFYPKAGGGASSARTGADGTYELIRDRETKGAVVGEYEVRISTANMGVPETLPAKYNAKSELLETVEPGRNVIDFELDYKGIIIQPPGGGTY